ncbi:MAG: TIGR04372 family glycosyltransferase [Thalassobaculum sp.]|uniref:TIGR04372 family glycosyltransferase n=1 Tax=Thalassobaculum sp. TaxID=2022740 RepID=UPI0032EAB159
MAALNILKRFMVRHAGNERLLARRVLLALWRKEASADELTPFLRPLFTVAYFVTFYEYLAVWLIATGGRLPPTHAVGNGSLVRALFPAIAKWLHTTFVERRPTMPPVNDVQGMAFVTRVLEGLEGHLTFLRAFGPAARVGEIRGQVEDVWRRASPRWILSSTFASNIGHMVYAATIIQLVRDGRIDGGEVSILRGHTRNPYLHSLFEPYMIDDMPADAVYAEWISTRKRYPTTDGRRIVMINAVSEAARVWGAAGRPFFTLDAELKARGDAVLAELGVPAGAPIVTLHVREAGYNDRRMHGQMRLRDAEIATYGAAVEWLGKAGFHVVRLGDASMVPAPDWAKFTDYPFSDAKAHWMDIYLAARCAFHIGTSSGMSFVPLLYGRPVVFTNWPTAAHMICAPGVINLPKVLLDQDGGVVPFVDYCGDHREILEASEAELFGLSFRDNSPDEILEAVQLMAEHLPADGSTLVLPDEPFEPVWRVSATAPVANMPRIPPGFFQRVYGG